MKSNTLHERAHRNNVLVAILMYQANVCATGMRETEPGLPKWKVIVRWHDGVASKAWKATDAGWCMSGDAQLGCLAARHPQATRSFVDATRICPSIRLAPTSLEFQSNDSMERCMQ